MYAPAISIPLQNRRVFINGPLSSGIPTLSRQSEPCQNSLFCSPERQRQILFLLHVPNLLRDKLHTEYAQRLFWKLGVQGRTQKHRVPALSKTGPFQGEPLRAKVTCWSHQTSPWAGSRRGRQVLRASRVISSALCCFFPTLMTGTRKMEYKDSSWHETCFVCRRCQQPIGTKSFIPKDNQNFCVPCYEKQYALQCVQCQKVSLILPWTLSIPVHLLHSPWLQPSFPQVTTPMVPERHRSLAGLAPHPKILLRACAFTPGQTPHSRPSSYNVIRDKIPCPSLLLEHCQIFIPVYDIH